MQLSFTLMDRMRRSVAVIAHGDAANPDICQHGADIVIFHAAAQEGLRQSPGSVWIYADAIVMKLGMHTLCGSPIEEVNLVGE